MKCIYLQYLCYFVTLSIYHVCHVETLSVGGVGRRAAAVIKVSTHSARRPQVSGLAIFLPLLEIFIHHTLVKHVINNCMY